MTKDELARRLASESKVSRAVAADQLDTLIHDILRRLRQGRPVKLPGLGTLQPKSRRSARLAPTLRREER